MHSVNLWSVDLTLPVWDVVSLLSRDTYLFSWIHRCGMNGDCSANVFVVLIIDCPMTFQSAPQGRLGEVAHAYNPSFLGGPRQVDRLRSGVQDQPDQHGETPSLLKIQN